MSDLPSVKQSLLPLASEIESMRKWGLKEKPKPHKLIMILAVFDLFDQDILKENKIYLNQQLISNFEKHFRMFSDNSDWCQPGPPFFHLRNSTFWKHKIKTGREENYEKLTTSGGGLLRIQQNIEYAYFDEKSFSIISQEANRTELRNFITAILMRLKDMDKNKRIPTVFHESFALSRPSLVQILNSTNTKPRNIILKSKEQREAYFREQTQLGMNYVKSMPEYAKGSGLLDFDYSLTTFGKFAHKSDPNLEHLGTLWLMHYYLSAIHGPGPIFWSEIISKKFRSGDEITQDEITDEICAIYFRDNEKSLSEGSAKSTANAFLETYIKSDALGKLGLLEIINPNHYRVLVTEVPPTWAMAIAILDYWKAHFPQQVTVNLNDLTLQSGLANQFMISRSRLEMVLGDMREIGIVELFRVAPPYQVALLNNNPEPIFHRMYSNE